MLGEIVKLGQIRPGYFNYVSLVQGMSV